MSDELPEGWAAAALGDVITGFEAGRNLRANGRAASGGEYGVLKISAVTWGAFRPEENKALLPGDEPKPHERIRNGDLLITRANTSNLVGAVVLVRRDYPELMLPDKILRLRLKDNTVEPKYLLHALRTQAVREHFEHNATGTSDSMRNLSQPKIAAAPITLAPLPEQRRIVAEVEALLEQVEHAQGRLDRVPPILKRFRQAVLAAACSGELTEAWRDLRDRDVARWEHSTIAEVCSAIVDTPHSTPKWTASGEVCLRTTNFFVTGLALEEVRYVSPETYRQRVARLVPAPGDVVYSREGGILGIACVIPPGVRACLGQRMMLMRGDTSRVRPDFLCAVLNSPETNARVVELTGGSASPHLNVSDIKRFEVPLPPLDEQDEILIRLSKLWALADTIERRVQAATGRADKLPQAILSKAFSGELVPTEAELARAEGRTYETAAELLERIQTASTDATDSRRSRPTTGRKRAGAARSSASAEEK